MAKPNKTKTIIQNTDTKDIKITQPNQDISDDKMIKQKIDSIQFDTFSNVFSSGSRNDNLSAQKSDSFAKPKESHNSHRQFFKRDDSLAPQKNPSYEKLTPVNQGSSQNLGANIFSNSVIQGADKMCKTTENFQNYVAIENALFSQSNLIDTEKSYFIKEHPDYFGDIYLSELQLFFQFKNLKVVNKCVQSKIVLLNKLLTCYLFQITK